MEPNEPIMSREAEFCKRKQRTDVAQVFLVFMSLVGDEGKTAAALDLEPAFVEWLAEQEGWKEKVRRISIMSKSEKPGDWERAQNRALNFCQAHRVRILIDRLLQILTNDSAEDPQQLLTRMSTTGKEGRCNISARFFADLTSAMEKVQTLSYYALGDSVGERRDRAQEEGSEVSAAQIHAALLQALNSPVSQGLSTQLLIEEVSSAVLAAEVERKSTEVSEHLPSPSGA